MHETILADAFRPATFRVLELELADYGLGHELGLWRRRNELVMPDGVAAVKQFDPVKKLECLTGAVMVCCQDAVLDGWEQKMKKAAKGLDLDAEVDRFGQYLAANRLDLPLAKMAARKSDAPFHYFGAPEVARLVNYLAAYHGQLIATHYQGSALAVPMGLARILYTTHLECAGEVWVENAFDARDKLRREEFKRQNPEAVAVGAEAVRALAEKWNRENPESPVPVE